MKIINSRDEFKKVDNLYESYLKIGVIGGAKTEYENRIRDLLLNLFKKLSDYRVIVWTGGTKGGVPEIASRTAKEVGFPVFGVVPKRGQKYILDDCLDYAVIVSPLFDLPSYWGDESAFLIKNADALIIIGGSQGALVEVAIALKINESILSNRKKFREGKKVEGRINPIYIIPLYGFGGIGSKITCLIEKPELNSPEIIPLRLPSSAEEIFNLLDKRFKLYDNYYREE